MWPIGTTWPMSTIKIRLDDPQESRRKWRYICNGIDPDANYEEVVAMLYDYFEKDEDRLQAVVRASKGPEFR